MNTGENEQGLRKIIDLTRLISIALLIVHCYYYCYRAFEYWRLTSTITDRFLKNIIPTGLFDHLNKSKIIALVFLFISLIGATGKKEEKLSYKTSLIYVAAGFIVSSLVITLYFLNYL